MYQYLFTSAFTDCVGAFAQTPQVSAALFDALSRLSNDPFDRTVLRTHRVQRAQGTTFTSRVGGGGHRVIWRLVNQTIVLLLFGEHDAVYRRAERLRLEVDTVSDLVQVVDRDPGTDQPTAYRERRAGEGRLFMAWTDAELDAFGFDPQEVAVLRVVDTETQLADLEPHMDGAAFERAYNLIAHSDPEGDVVVGALDQDRAPVQGDAELERLLRTPAAREEFVPVPADELADILARPIEDWMVFLHPDQVRLTQRSYSGPARIRGGAGTGKTVVALHRARHLAGRVDGRILFTTYVRTLPTVLASLFARLAPELADRVEFANLHRWAYRSVKAGGVPFDLDLTKVDHAFDTAWGQVAGPGSYLADRGYGRGYYREEIDWVLKGRDLRSLNAYLALERTGRGTALNEAHRREVWELYAAYQRELALRGVVDFNDLLILALQRARQEGATAGYAAVLVDEAQDLTEVGARLVHALVGDRPDGLLLVGDEAQSVYPGGYTMREAGIDVVGRAGTLRVNYRNSGSVLKAARQLGGVTDVVARESQPGARAGSPVALALHPNVEAHDAALLDAVLAVLAAPSVEAGDLAVLLPTNRLAEEYRRRLTTLEVACLDLGKYDGNPIDAVKVGTYQRAKGLEFKHVFLPRLEARTLGDQPRPGEDPDTHRERLALLRRRLFVAATRARDGLWLSAAGEPSAVLDGLAQS